MYVLIIRDKYETKQEEIPYYNFVESTENTKGTMQEEKTIIKYYYEKQVFNLKVDKWVSKVNVNGITQLAQSFQTKGQTYKLEIARNKIETANVKITYTIRVSNVGEIEGTVKTLTEIIPTGYSFYKEDNNIQWQEENGILTTTGLENETIKAGEYKEIEVTLRWKTSGENLGEKANRVILTQISNPAGYTDIYKDDNTAKSDMILTVSTGLDGNDRIMIIGIVQIVLAISIGLLFSYKKKS